MAQTLQAKVVSINMAQTVVVEIERKMRHSVYKKVVSRHKKITAHSETGTHAVGDMVTITPCRPISKTKRYKVIS